MLRERREREREERERGEMRGEDSRESEYVREVEERYAMGEEDLGRERERGRERARVQMLFFEELMSVYRRLHERGGLW